MSPEQDSKVDRELLEELVARHHRVKGVRRALLNTLIGLSGGALVLSVSLLNQIAPQKLYSWVVIV